MRDRSAPKSPCSSCGTELVPYKNARGMCLPCYHRVWDKAHYDADPQSKRDRRRAYRATNLDEERERDRKAAALKRAADPDRARALLRDHYTKHREEYRIKNRAAYAANAEERKQRQREWSAANPDKIREGHHRRRAYERNAFVEHVDHDIIYERDHGICQICEKPVEREKMSLDHIIPISRGGTHEPKNVQLSHISCNQRRYVTGPAQIRMW